MTRKKLNESKMPAVPELERAILGVILLDNSTYHQAAELLRRSDFYVERHRQIYGAMQALSDRAEPIDPLTLRAELKSQGVLDQVGGISEISRLMDGTPHLGHLEHYVKLVHDKAVLRRLIVASNRTIRECLADDAPAEAIVSRAESRIVELEHRNHGGDSYELGEIMRGVLKDIEERSHNGEPAAIRTGLIDVDRMLMIEPGDLVVIGGRPSSGKTALAIMLSKNVTAEGRATLLASLEMSWQQMAQRLLAAESRISLGRIRRGELSREEWSRLTAAGAALRERPLVILDRADVTPAMLRAHVLKRRERYHCVIVDYLQLMSTGERYRASIDELTELSRALKCMARELQVPLILLSQLNRAVESRIGNRPRLSDLRGSGTIEQDADIVLFVHRPDQYTQGEHTGRAELIIAKQRNGPQGVVPVFFIEETATFANLRRPPPE